MISHKHKCIFIHITKCAGTSIEEAFGIDTKENSLKNINNLYGWHQEQKMYLQHATPQMLLDCNLITEKIWNTYYKFIIVRNPWERMYSDYIWFYTRNNVRGTFKEYISMQGPYKSILTDKSTSDFRGDHMYLQKDYFFLNKKEIKYDFVIRMENIKEGLKQITRDLSLPNNFFRQKHQLSILKKNHYSNFYDSTKRKLVDFGYGEDIDYLGYKYEYKFMTLLNIYRFLPTRYYIWKYMLKK